jgi:hypothetical protein
MPYAFTPLCDVDAIRLIVLYPSPELDAPLEIDLINTTLVDFDNDIADSYIALSYAWGDASDR